MVSKLTTKPTDRSPVRLAEICGMHRNYLGTVERAERTPSIVAADRIARALGTTLAEMFAEVEREPNDGW